MGEQGANQANPDRYAQHTWCFLTSILNLVNLVCQCLPPPNGFQDTILIYSLIEDSCNLVKSFFITNNLALFYKIVTSQVQFQTHTCVFISLLMYYQSPVPQYSVVSLQFLTKPGTVYLLSFTSSFLLLIYTAYMSLIILELVAYYF